MSNAIVSNNKGSGGGAVVMPSLSAPGVSLTTTECEAGLDVCFSGTADMSAIDALDAFLEAVHTIATTRRVRRVKVDLRALSFMSSSCFKSFVMWIGLLQDAAPADRYRIEFFANARMLWQRRSLNALQCFALDLISIDT